MGNLMRETDILLLQQSRLNTDLQQGLMHTRLLPFNSIVPRLERIVRQTNSELNKQSQLLVSGADLVVTAIAQGRQAAQQMLEDLQSS